MKFYKNQILNFTRLLPLYHTKNS
uniref:Uncharacterized protein n=1 Tax=Rhizophora mucronata TaxID=61149 RepID=A0A2P2N8C6_RHIMU